MTLYLLPNVIGYSVTKVLSQNVLETAQQLQGLIAESMTGGRSFLRMCHVPDYLRIPISIFKKKSNTSYLDFLLQPVLSGEKWGVVSDAGMPCIADPGSQLVLRARHLGISVRGFSGPCSITLSLMLSGLPGQNFSFLGYFPRSSFDRTNCIRQCCKQKGMTWIFIETPYRNEHSMQALMDTLPDYALLCIAMDLQGEQEFIDTKIVAEWRNMDFSEIKINIRRVPVIFLFYIP